MHVVEGKVLCCPGNELRPLPPPPVCCCGCSIQVGVTITAIFFLLTNILALVFLCVFVVLVLSFGGSEGDFWYIIVFAVSSFLSLLGDTGFNMYLLVGVMEANPGYCKAWLRWAMAMMTFLVIFVVVNVGLFNIMGGLVGGISAVRFLYLLYFHSVVKNFVVDLEDNPSRYGRPNEQNAL